MKIEINIPDSVINRMNELGISENDHDDVVTDFINDKLDLSYEEGLLDLFKRWSLKKDNVETYIK